MKINLSILSLLILLNSCGGNNNETSKEMPVTDTATISPNVKSQNSNQINHNTENSNECDKFLLDYKQFIDDYNATVKKYLNNHSSFLEDELESFNQEFNGITRRGKHLDCSSTPSFYERYNTLTKEFIDLEVSVDMLIKQQRRNREAGHERLQSNVNNNSIF